MQDHDFAILLLGILVGIFIGHFVFNTKSIEIFTGDSDHWHEGSEDSDDDNDDEEDEDAWKKVPK